MITLSKETLLETFYPVGSVYITINSDIDPNTTFGGTWELLQDGRFLEATTDTARGGN